MIFLPGLKKTGRRGYRQGLFYSMVFAISIHLILIIIIKGFGVQDPEPDPWIQISDDPIDFYLSEPDRGDTEPIPDEPPPENPRVPDPDGVPVVKPNPEDPGDYSGPIFDFTPNPDSTPNSHSIQPTPRPPVGETRKVSLIKKGIPTYPKLARNMGIEGSVIFRVTIGTKGEVISISLEHSSGSDILDNAAERAIKDCLFIPAMNNGTALKQDILITYHFILQDDEVLIK